MQKHKKAYSILDLKPISIPQVASKLIEKGDAEQLQLYITQNNILPKQRFDLGVISTQPLHYKK